VTDFRKLNDKTIGDTYSLPNITDFRLEKAKYFSCFDLAMNFHQIPMDSHDSIKTAFIDENYLMSYSDYNNYCNFIHLLDIY